MPTMADPQESSINGKPDSDAPEQSFRITWFVSSLPKAAILIGAIALIADVFLIACTSTATQKALATYAFIHANDSEPVVAESASTGTYFMSLICKNCLNPYQHEYPLGTPVTLDHACPACGMLGQGFDVKRGKVR